MSSGAVTAANQPVHRGRQDVVRITRAAAASRTASSAQVSTKAALFMSTSAVASSSETPPPEPARHASANIGAADASFTHADTERVRTSC